MFVRSKHFNSSLLLYALYSNHIYHSNAFPRLVESKKKTRIGLAFQDCLDSPCA